MRKLDSVLSLFTGLEPQKSIYDKLDELSTQDSVREISVFPGKITPIMVGIFYSNRCRRWTASLPELTPAACFSQLALSVESHPLRGGTLRFKPAGEQHR